MTLDIESRPIASGKTKVAIVGGGCGGISAAFWLTSTPQLRERYEVTVYTQGWRIGGKGASGRNTKASNRIEEHGLHMWMGCYENAFRTMRSCYAEWKPNPASPITSFEEAFTPQRQVTFQQQSDRASSGWTPWHFKFPRWPGTPGDGASTVYDAFMRLAEWIRDHLLGSSISHLTDADIEHRQALKLEGPSEASPAASHGLRNQIIAAADAIHCAFANFNLMSREALKRDLILANLALSFAKGLIADVLPHGDAGFDRIDHLDLREWLAGHGASVATLESAVVRAVYDLGFAYPHGESGTFSNGRGAAGAGARFLLEMAFGYKDAPLWKMNAGMGDIVFTPFFQVLKARGVAFEFFHRLTSVEMAEGQRSIAALHFDRQATLKTGSYEPLVTVDGLDCWPNEPLWDQLQDGAALREKGVNFESSWKRHATGTVALDAGNDFDAVVLTLPPEVLRTVAQSLRVSDAWAAMIDNSTSVATQACQLWVRPTLEALGWTSGPPVMTSFAPPFDTWADMSHVMERESWRGGDVPGSLAYFCGAMTSPPHAPGDPVAQANATAEDNAKAWLKENINTLWPGSATRAAGLADADIISSYYRGNVDPSERYVQTPPGSVQYRIAPDAKLFDNLYVAGDWTLTRFSGGCVESAVESGMLVSRAMCGEPAAVVTRDSDDMA